MQEKKISDEIIYLQIVCIKPFGWWADDDFIRAFVDASACQGLVFSNACGLRNQNRRVQISRDTDGPIG